MARKRCSVETYSSLKLAASLKARSRTSFNALPMCCCAKPCTLGSLAISFSISCARSSPRIPRRAKSGGTTPSACAASAASKCTGSTCWFSCLAATSCAACTASCALTVILSNLNIATSFPAPTTEKGLARWPAPFLTTVSRNLLRCGSGHRLSSHVDLDLLGLGFLTLRDSQRQHAVLVIRLDRLGVHGVRQREAAGERTIGTLDTQVVVLVHVFRELALPADRQDVVLHADVQILGINVREIGLHHQFMLRIAYFDSSAPCG